MSIPHRTLSPNSSLENLRREAKRWLRQIAAGDADAVARFNTRLPGRAEPKLREVQHALALDYDFPSWAALKQEIEDRARSHADRVRLFLEKSAIRYSTAPGSQEWNTYEPDRPHRGQLAARLLHRHPEIARESLHTAVAAGDVEAVRACLATDPASADRRGGPDGWTPLLRLAYTRLPVSSASGNALEIARLLLDAGASPTASWDGKRTDFTVLTGAIGGGENEQPPHPQAEALARLLIAHGADPLNGQALYNTSLSDDDTFWLDLLWAESDRRGETGRWKMDVPHLIGPGLDYLLGNAVTRQHIRRAAWLLDHGADANARHAYSKEPVIRHAAMAGRQDIVDLLVRHGAARPALSDDERFVGAVVQGDAPTVRRLAAAHPDFLLSPSAMFAAIQHRRADMAELLLDLGLSPDIGDDNNFRALHQTTHANTPAIARLLIARGAEIDPFERTYGGTPLSHALYNGRPDMIAILAPVSRNVRGLCFAGCVDRLRELFGEDRTLVDAPIHDHEPPVFCLPDNDEQACELAELLLSFNAKLDVRNANGFSPSEAARKRGLEDAADLLEL
jgi:ankyrin repeat protein